MSQLTSLAPDPQTSRRVRQRIAAALAVLLLAVGLRSGLDWFQERTAVPEPPPAPIGRSGDEAVARYQERLRANAEDVEAYAALGLALLEQARVNGDATLYSRAQTAFEEALTREPGLPDALIGQGMLALSRHDFVGALAWAEKARSVNPFRAETVGVEVDAYVELGRYPEAIAAAQEMVDMRPGVASFTRVSYIRELHGNVTGAIQAMQAAVDAGVPGSEATLWSQVQLGHLYFRSGDWQQAEEHYQAALSFQPDYLHGRAGLARIQAARGNVDQAIAAYEEIVDRLPLPEFVIPLGELYMLTGQADRAETQWGLVRIVQALNAEAGMDVDLEMALFDADYGTEGEMALKRARAVYEQRPSIYAADALAWALYRQGVYAEAWTYSQESLRLGTQDPMLHFHAGMIALALDDLSAARHHLDRALAINPAFSIRYAPTARRIVMDITPG